MDNLLKDFSLLGISALAVVIVVLSTLVRRVVELALPELKKDERKGSTTKVTIYSGSLATWYNEFLLYLLPYLVASVVATVKVPFIYGDINTYSGRLFFALLVATFSATIYKGVKKALPGLFGVTAEDDDKVLPAPPKE
jgi:hypothetical protein